MVDWVECKSVWVVDPEFANGFVGCEAAKGLESPGEVVGCDEVRQVRFELFVGVIEEAFDGCFLDGPVHAFDLTVRPRMLDLVSLCSMPFSRQRISNMCVMDLAVGPSAYRGGGEGKLIMTAKLNDIDPQAWLADVLARINDHPIHRLDELLPWNWAAEMERRKLAA